MSGPLEPTSPSPPGSIHVAECWADLARSLTLYPAANSRVQRSLGAFVAALRAGSDPATRRVELGFAARTVWVNETSFPLKAGSNLVWLKERLDRSDLSGASFSATVDEAELIAFTQRLLDHFTRRDLERGFAELWSEPFAGLVPLERRFEGAFSESAGEGEGEPHESERPNIAGRARHKEKTLRNALTLDARVRAKVEEVQAKLLAGAASGAELGRIDLVDEIVELLPAEGLHDYETAVGLSLGMIQALVDRLGRERARLGPTPEERSANLKGLLLTVGRSHFSSFEPQVRALPQEPDDEDSVPTVLAAPYDRVVSFEEDSTIQDDLRELMAEIERECPVPEGRIEGRDCEDAPEELGVFLHVLAAHDDPSPFPALRPGIERLLRASGEPGLEVVRAYLTSSSPPVQGQRSPAQRVAGWLRRHGLRSVLRACGVLDAQWVCREFPEDFLEYLSTLDLANPKDREELDQVCRTIGPRRFGVAADLLGGASDFLASPLANRLFGLHLVSLGPFVRQIYERDKRRFKASFARHLRATHAKGIDATILDLVEVGPCLLSGYLNALADQDGERLGEQRLAVVRAFLTATAGDPAREAHHVRAIKLLANFDSPQTRAFLTRLVDERRHVFLRRHSRAVRDAAVEVLRSFQAKGGPEDV